MAHCPHRMAVERIEREVSVFGSKRIALREFRRLTGQSTIRKLAHLRTYLNSMSVEALEPLYLGLKLRLCRMSYPHRI